MTKIALVIIAFFCLSVLASADVTVKYKSEAKITNKAVLKIESNYIIKENKSYCELKSNFSMPGGGGTPFDISSKSITRLDKGVRWSLLGSAYSEETITSMHDSMGLADEYNWTFNLSPIADQKKIRKFECYGQIGKAVGVSKVDPADTVFLTFEQWATEDTLGATELFAYEDSFAQQSGTHKMWSQEHVSTYLEKGYGTQFGLLSDLLAQRRGLPVQSYFQIEQTVLYNNSDGAPKRRGTGIRPENGGYWKIFSMTNELVSIENKNIDDKKFEIPANYKKK